MSKSGSQEVGQDGNHFILLTMNLPQWFIGAFLLSWTQVSKQT